METKIFDFSPESINASAIAEAAKMLKDGGLIAFPTETFYGLGGDATDPNAAKKIYKAKGRPSDNPLIIHIATPEDAEKYAYTCELYYKLAEAFMPGPLTVILKKKDTVPFEVTGGLDTVAVRCPSHPIANALIKEFGEAIAAPSANLSGSPSPTSGEHVISDLNGRIEGIINGGECDIGLESTIVSLDGNTATLLRPGAITRDALLCVCDEVNIASAVTKALERDERPLSPGMKYRHYAPKAPLVLIDGSKDDVLSFFIEKQKSETCAIICYTEECSSLSCENLIELGRENDLEAQAKNLFSALRNADTLNVEIIYAHLPPKSGLGLALYNRLIRAAAHTILEV